MEPNEGLESLEDMLLRISDQLSHLNEMLPEDLIAPFDQQNFKSSHLACVLLGSLIYRATEVGQNAFKMLKANNLVSSALLSRAVLECAATAFALKGKIANRKNKSAEELHSQINNLVFGSRLVKHHKLNDRTIPETVNIQTHLNKLMAEEPTVMDNYDFVSELCHPNGAGVMGLFCSFDQASSTTTFGPNFQNKERLALGCAMNLTYSLRVFTDVYTNTNRVCVEWLTPSST